MNTPLHSAAKAGHTAVVEFLLESKADIEAKVHLLKCVVT
jgi:ankyrin repeat protein